MYINLKSSISLLSVLLICCSGERLIDKASTCNQEILDRSFVTQCGPARCEPLLEVQEAKQRLDDWPATRDEVIHVVSSRDQHRFKVHKYKAMNTMDFYYAESHINGTMFANPDIKYQKILGFGTFLTDASCRNVDDLPDDVRAKLISDYFSPANGIGLNLIKVPIGSTEFSHSNYVLDYLDSSQLELSSYDTDQRIPLIKDALDAAGRFRSRVKLIASSATAPAEMKQNNKIVHGGFLRDDKFLDYASYLTSFAAAYKSHGLDLWSLVLSKSPATVADRALTNDSLDYNTLAMKPSDAVKLIRATLQARSNIGGKSLRLFLLGDSRSYIPVWADAVLKQTNVANNVAGVAYTCENNSAPYDNLAYVNKRFPNKYLLTVQGSSNSPLRLGSWEYAENYASEIVKNLEFGSVAWLDSNMALNLEGGPCLSDRFKSDAAVIVDPKTKTYYRNPMFYAIGHLSRYVKPGSIRVKCVFYSSPHMYATQHIAFTTPDNYLVVFVMNSNINPMPISVGIDKVTKVEVMLDTKSFNTFIFRL